MSEPQDYQFINVRKDPVALGRILPDDLSHLDDNRLVTAYTAAEVEVILDARFDVADLRFYYQNGYPRCIGFGTARAMTILNGKRYGPTGLYYAAQKRDGIPGPHAGSTVHGVAKVLIDDGATVARPDEDQYSKRWAPEKPEGIESVLYARSVDDCRTCGGGRVPLIIGVDWCRSYASPTQKDGELWIGGPNRGPVVGGHCVCIRGFSDRRQAFGITNSHGPGWGEIVWTPYSEMEWWLRRGGEVALPVDRTSPTADYSFLA